MRLSILAVLCFFISINLHAQKKITNTANKPANTENIYDIKKQFLYEVLHNPAEKTENDDDNDLERFNRWFNDVEPRCYPTGNLPRPDVILTARQQAVKTARKAQKLTAAATWQPLGPINVPSNHNGIGRVNCIIIDPLDTNTLYVGTACGGVFISHNGGTTWTSNTDNFPSLSIADIAVNPKHTDTIYAATGDGYGYSNGSYNIFWGGLYSAGIMKSTDGGSTWDTTGLSYLQTNNDIIQRLLIHPNKTNILLAATRNGIKRTTDAGATWTTVDAGHVYSMQFKPGRPDTIYAVNNSNLRVSYNAGATWQTLYTGINPTGNRCTIGVSPASPNAIWVLDGNEDLQWSHNGGLTFSPTLSSPDDTASFYGYYDRVLAISPADSNYVLAFGLLMGKSVNGGATWNRLDPAGDVHADNHAVAFNPLHPQTIYSGNDGGISVTRNGGSTWTNLGNGLMISQIYKMASSLQSPDMLLCGLQDNGTFRFDGTNWRHKTGGDGMDCAIHPLDDFLQISSSQYGYFNISVNQGVGFAHVSITSETGSWTAPVAVDPNNSMNIFFGYKNIYATYNQGSSFFNLTSSTPFPGGATSLAIANANSKVLYACDYGHILRTTDGGTTWTDVTGNLPASTVAIRDIAIDFSDAMHVYVVTSGYSAGNKVFMSTVGGTTWTNISTDLPNLPVNCIAIDSSTAGALFVGTDIGVYYTDAAQTGWTLYNTGLPNVIVNDLDINYGNYKVRAGTYGRGVWECKLKKDRPTPVKVTDVKTSAGLQVYPNPATNNWKIIFPGQKPTAFTVKLTDINGRVLSTRKNTEVVDASGLASGVYNIEVTVGNDHYTIKAVRE